MPVIATPIAASAAVGRYAQQSDIESQFGVANVQQWSQLDSSQTVADVTRIQTALNFADAEIISTFARFGNYATPLAPLAEAVDLVTYWDAVLAGAWLYQSRGLRDDDAAGNHISQLAATVRLQMRTYRAADKLNAARRWPVATAPVAV